MELPLHPVIVHFPVALTLFFLFLYPALILWIGQKEDRQKTWAVVPALSLLLVLLSYGALFTGEQDEELVEEVISHEALEAHEHAAEYFFYFTWVPFLISLAGIKPWKGRKPARWMAVLAGFIGVLIIIRPGLIAIQPGVFVALATALMFAGYNVLTRLVARYDDGETSTVYMALIGTAVLCCIGPFYWVPLPAWDWFLLICLSLNAACGHFLLIKALEAAPAATLQPFNYTLLVFATVIGYFVFDNLPDLWTVTGAAVIVISGLYTIYRERERKPAG